MSTFQIAFTHSSAVFAQRHYYSDTRDLTMFEAAERDLLRSPVAGTARCPGSPPNAAVWGVAPPRDMIHGIWAGARADSGRRAGPAERQTFTEIVHTAIETAPRPG